MRERGRAGGVLAAIGLCAASCRTAGPGTAGEEWTVTDMVGDHMVLQQGMPVPLWGRAGPGAEVQVGFGGQIRRATADTRGNWRVTLDPMPACAEPRDLVVESPAGHRRSTVTDVLVGEVWFCSGQSNMELALKKTEDGVAAAAAANHPLVRLYNVPHRSADEPQTRCGGQWQVCSPEAAAEFSGVAYYFGRDIQAARGVPVGLVHSAWSGACAESWLPADRLDQHPVLRQTLKRWQQYRRDYPKRLTAYEADLAAWEAAGKAGRRPARPKDPNGPEMSVGRLYNGMLHPVLPYAIRGVLWYQGENNILAVDEYRTLFPFLIREWRRMWGQGDVPFLFVQIAGFGAPAGQPEDSIWAHLREAQTAGLSEPQTGMVTAIDIGGDFHPRNKRDVGLRLAGLARVKVYGENSRLATGPRFRAVRFEGGRATVTFNDVGGGLRLRDGEVLEGFSVAGADRRFVWANARIEGDTVVVWSDAVPAPASVRYAWATHPRANLVNSEGLPAFPFRTDDWPPTQGL